MRSLDRDNMCIIHQVFKVDYLELSADILRWDFKGL